MTTPQPNNPPRTARQWRAAAKRRAWIIRLLERRIDSLEQELRELQEGSKA